MAVHVLEQQSGPVCGVFAAAMASGQPFHQVFDQARKLAGKAAHWKGWMQFSAVQKLLTSLGVQIRACEGYKGQTLQKAAAELPAEQHYIVYVTDHFLTLHQGLVFDQRHPKGCPVGDYHWRRKRVHGMVKVL